MSAASEMAEYTAAAFYSYEAMRDARDEALCRVQELTDERDQARRIAASLEAEVAKVRELHRAQHDNVSEALGLEPYAGDMCAECYLSWPCATAEAVYLP